MRSIDCVRRASDRAREPLVSSSPSPPSPFGWNFVLRGIDCVRAPRLIVCAVSPKMVKLRGHGAHYWRGALISGLQILTLYLDKGRKPVHLKKQDKSEG